MVMTKITVKNGKAIVKMIRNFSPFAVNKIGEHLSYAATQVMDNAVELCPMDTGNLRKTAFIIGATYTNVKYNKVNYMFDNKRKDIAKIVAGMEESRVKYMSSSYTGITNMLYNPVIYGGFSAYYAVTVHETQANYKVGQWKFLQVAMDNTIPGVREFMYRGLKGIVKDYSKYSVRGK